MDLAIYDEKEVESANPFLLTQKLFILFPKNANLKNPKHGKYPRVRRVSVWLTHSISFKLDLDEMKVWIRDVGELPILGYPRNLNFYKGWNIREARLIFRQGKAFLKVSLFKDYKEPLAKDGVDINMYEILECGQEFHSLRKIQFYSD